ncbi:MAG: hypothetical protein ACAH80_18405 [Alphaproteobacteria bacterium]
MAVDVAEYYAANKHKEREYVRVYAARPVKEGDTYVNGIFQCSVDEPGYRVSAYNSMQKSEEKIMTAAEFKEKTEAADAFFPAVPKEDIDADDMKRLTPVRKGKRIAINVGVPILTEAAHDGFLYTTEKDGDIFISNYGLTTQFNYAGKKEQTHEDLLVKMKDEPAFKGMILAEDVTFNFKSGPFDAKAGSFVQPNPDDEDGFTAWPPGYAQFGMRRTQSDEQLAALVDVRTDDELKVSKPLKFKK